MVTGISCFERRFIRLHEGQLSYVQRPGPGPALILIPGMFSPCTQWGDVVARLDTDLHLVLAEMRGHGESWPAAVNGSIEMFAVDVVRIANDLCLHRFYVGGHSLGGMIAIEVAELRPDTVKGVIAIEGWTSASVLEAAFQGAGGKNQTPEVQQRVTDEKRQTLARMSEEQAQDIGQTWRRWDGYHILSTTDIPILEIWGDRGRARPDREKLRIPERGSIELHWLADAGHSLPHERPEELAEAINAFIRRLEVRG